MNKTTVLFPGGFKPLTGAHLALAQRYAEHPDVERVIMLIGPKDRDGITRADTQQIFDLIQMNSSANIEMQPTEFNSPITAAYEYLFALPEDDQGRYAMAASTKGDDYVRTKSFVPNVDKYITIGDRNGRKMPAGIDAVELTIASDPVLYPANSKLKNSPISASTVRQAIADRNTEIIKQSYPGVKPAVVDNIVQILLGKQEARTFSTEWWTKQLAEEVDVFIEGYQTPKLAKRHDAKIKKLRGFLNNNDKEFVYDFDRFDKTVFGVPLLERLLQEGGAAGHMAHPYDDYGLTFNDMKEIVSRALEGRLDIEEAVTEKTDGQNIQVTWKNGEPGFARGKKTIIDPMTPDQLIAEFEAKYQKQVDANGVEGAAGYLNVVDAYRACAEDLTSALNQLGAERLQQIFKNGRVFANMEIIFPATKNVIAYDKAHLQFHNLVEYDAQGNVVQTDLSGGKMLGSVIRNANADMQKTFSFIPPQQIRLGRVSDFEDQQAAFYSEIDQLRSHFSLKETDLVSEYHKKWWEDVIRQKAYQLNYTIPQDVISALTYRWAFFDKSTSLTQLKKQIDNAEFLEWVREFDKKEFKQYYKQNMEPFESIFLRLGAVALKNAENFLAANPDKAVQEIRREMADLIRELQASPNPETIKKLELELKRIERLGGFDAIVPSEGIVFVYRGKTYKLTGAFAPVNQVLGTLKYAR
jgi:hypothetical protein